MKFSTDIKRSIKYVIGISTALSILMILIFWVMGRFTLSVLAGSIYGCFLSCFNFFLLAVTLNKAVDVKNGGKAVVGLSYTGRTVLLLLGAVIGIVWLKVNAVSLIIPYVFPRIAIGIMQIREIRQGRRAGRSSEDGS